MSDNDAIPEPDAPLSPLERFIDRLPRVQVPRIRVLPLTVSLR